MVEGVVMNSPNFNEAFEDFLAGAQTESERETRICVATVILSGYLRDTMGTKRAANWLSGVADHLHDTPDAKL